MDGVAIRDERPVAVTDPLGLHRPLHPPLQLDRLELRSEEPRGLPFEKSLEEPLKGGQGSHDRWRLYQSRRSRAATGCCVEGPSSLNSWYLRLRTVKTAAI